MEAFSFVPFKHPNARIAQIRQDALLACSAWRPQLSYIFLGLLAINPLVRKVPCLHYQI
jgi:hypothetical protein